MRKNKGFTLLELLIVIGCIVALVTIAYPAFGQYREKNRENADVVAMHSAEALFTTAYNTGKLIDGRSATEATAANPLYYDGNGDLTWTAPRNRKRIERHRPPKRALHLSRLRLR